jgi:hypothetical protein
MKDDILMMNWKGLEVGCRLIEVLFRYLPGGYRRNHENSQ